VVLHTALRDYNPMARDLVFGFARDIDLSEDSATRSKRRFERN